MRARWWVLIAFVVVLLTAVSAWLIPRIDGQGPVVQVMEFDSHRTELTQIAFGARATRTTMRKAPISEQIVEELRAEGLGDLIVLLDQVSRDGWYYTTDYERGAGKAAVIQGKVKCVAADVMARAKSLLSTPTYGVNSAGFQLRGTTRASGRDVSFYLFTTPGLGSDEYSLNFQIR